MMDFIASYAVSDLAWIGLSLLLLGMSKGGFPVGSVALPLLILVWPQQGQATREAVGFMLPMLCLMDCIALALYRRHVLWKRLVYLIPAMIAGVALAGVLFVSDEFAVLSVSDRVLKLLIGVLGILFVFYFMAKRWILKHIHVSSPGWAKGSLFGFFAGITSTLAHAAGPVMQMYFLPQQLEKKKFAATTCAFFWMMNGIKLIPFIWAGRIHPDGLKLGGIMLPVIPLGVLLGWWLTHKTEQRHYIAMIYIVLFAASVSLIVKAF